MLFRMGKVSRELWLYLGPAWKRFVNGDCIFFFCLLNHTGLPNHREITVWEIRRSLMCLKTLSKSGVRIYKLFFALHLYLLLFIFHVPYQEKKNRKRPFQPLDVLKISCTRRINYKACSRFTFWLAHQILWCDPFNVLYGPVRSIFFFSSAVEWRNARMSQIFVCLFDVCTWCSCSKAESVIFMWNLFCSAFKWHHFSPSNSVEVD